jgi:YggT family protein
MFAVANFLFALAKVIQVALFVYYWLILIRALISWVNPDPYNPIVQFLYKATEPVLEPIRKMLPLNFQIGIDVSPLIAFLIILFLQSFLPTTLVDIGLRLTR